MKITLGLDLGTNSIGWCLITDNGNIIDLGVRIFLRSVDAKNNIPKNQHRRKKRLMRRLIQRKAQRRRNLELFLINYGFLPTAIKNNLHKEIELNKLGDCYHLRNDALLRPLTKYELGRALLHIGSRRGFLSTRKLMVIELLDDPDMRDILQELENKQLEGDLEASNLKNEVEQTAEKEEEVVKKAISELSKAMGDLTLGQYLYSLPEKERKRNKYTSREMYKDEVKKIFDFQQQFHPELTSNFLESIENIIFYQRPVRWDKNTIGKCSLEPKLKRTNVARLEFQRFRYYQDLHNLSWLDNEVYVKEETGEICNINHILSFEQKQKIAEILEKQKSISWNALKKKLNIKNCTFNLEKKNKKGLIGNITSCSLRGIYSKWNDLTHKEQEQLVEDLLSFEKIIPLKNRLKNHWKCSNNEALELINFSRENSSLRAGYSLKVLKKIVPLMIEQNMSHSEAQEKLGYNIISKNKNILDRLPDPPQIANPIVQKALYEVRKLVNTIINTYGKPDEIHVELPRDFINSKKYKKTLEKQNIKNQELNLSAKKEYTNFRKNNSHLYLPIHPSYNDLIKYRLWKEQKEQCIYSGKPISLAQLFSSEIEIDHILPYTRTVNDSYMNKVICFRYENRFKGARTPHEAYSDNSKKYALICKRALELPPVKKSTFKKQAFFIKDLGSLDSFINSQLSDTAYISVQVVNYLGKLFDDKNKIITTKGGVTALLRNNWGLDSILGTNNQKNRTDHRHHAIDAAVIALTDKKRYKQIVDNVKCLPENKRNDLRNLNLTEPWNGFRNQLKEKINNIIVSHATNHKITGALHEETAYGVRFNKENGTYDYLVYRVPLTSKFDNIKLKKVVDEKLKDFLKDHIKKFKNMKEAFSPENLPIRNIKQGKIRHVRIYAEKNYNSKSYREIIDKNSNKIKTVYPYGNNHHLEIYKSSKTGKYEAEKITMFEAAKRLNILEQNTMSKNNDPTKEFIMALYINDMVEATGKDKITRVYRVQKISDNIKLRLHSKAFVDIKRIQDTPESLIEKDNMKKITKGSSNLSNEKSLFIKHIKIYKSILSGKIESKLISNESDNLNTELKNNDPDKELIMDLYVDDKVKITKNKITNVYRITDILQNKIILELDAKQDVEEEIETTANSLIKNYEMKLIVLTTI